PEHDHALYPDSKGESGPLVGVIAHRFQNLGVHEARAENFQPARALAYRAALAAAKQAADVHLRRRLGERKIRGPEASLGLRAEKALDEQAQSALEVGHRDAL